MNKSIIYILFLSVIGFLSSCSTAVDTNPANVVTQETVDKITAYGKNKGLTFTRTAEDVFYVITNPNATNRKPLNYEYCKVHYVLTKLDGTITDSTAVVRKIPFTFLYTTSANSLVSYAVNLMKEGETSVFVFPSTASSTEPLAMKLTLVSTRNEAEQVAEYVKANYNGLPVKKTVSGLQYLITKTSSAGDSVKVGKNVTVTYTGRFLFQYRSSDSNGFPIYTDKFDGGSFSFVVGLNPPAVVVGFEEAAKLMKVGDKGTFVFSSDLGYKAEGRGSVPPYTPMLFEIEVTAVK
jgi:FKBP-type peptidyl-prolyl cis-trans isomerase